MARRPNLRERLQVIMEAEGWSQAQLARAAGCSRQAVTNWMNGDYQTIEARFAFNISDASRSRFEPRWIMYGEGKDRRPEPPRPEEAEILDEIRRLPPAKREAIAALLKS